MYFRRVQCFGHLILKPQGSYECEGQLTGLNKQTGLSLTLAITQPNPQARPNFN